MKRSLKAMASLVLAAMLLVTPASAASEYTTVAAPGETVGFSKSEFFNTKNGYVIDSAVDLDNKNFEVYKKTIKTGANLIDDIRINSRNEEVQIILKTNVGIQQAPTKPNVVISALSVRAIRNVKDIGGGYLLRTGDTFAYDGTINLRVGMETRDEVLYRDDSTISLMSGDTNFVRWVDGGDGYGNVRIEYGSLGYGEQRVYPREKVLYRFDDTVPESLQDANSSAYIQACDMGQGTFEYGMKFQLLANEDDYIYEYANGKLKAASGLKWSDEDYAWTTKLYEGKFYIISDRQLRGASGTTGGDSSSAPSYDDEEDAVDPGYDNDYYNPSTGGGSNVAVAVSAIAAILAISALSIIMSTILAVKKK